MSKRKKHVMSYKCCEDCSNRPESLYKKCRYFWHVGGSSDERSMCIFKTRTLQFKDWTPEEQAEEIRKCKESPAYFFNKYCVLRDKDGNEIDKPVLTDEDIKVALQLRKLQEAYDFRKLSKKSVNSIILKLR